MTIPAIEPIDIEHYFWLVDLEKQPEPYARIERFVNEHRHDQALLERFAVELLRCQFPTMYFLGWMDRYDQQGSYTRAKSLIRMFIELEQREHPDDNYFLERFVRAIRSHFGREVTDLILHDSGLPEDLLAA